MAIFLIWLFDMAVTVFWILDICNMPFIEMFDTTYPLNTLFWFLVMLFCGGSITVTNKIREDKKNRSGYE